MWKWVWTPVWVPSHYHAGVTIQSDFMQVEAQRPQWTPLPPQPTGSSAVPGVVGPRRSWRLRNAKLERPRTMNPARRFVFRLRNAKWQPPQADTSSAGGDSVWDLPPLQGDAVGSDATWERFEDGNLEMAKAKVGSLLAIPEEEESDSETREGSEEEGAMSSALPPVEDDSESESRSVSEEPAGGDVCVKASFDGSWSGRGVIREGKLTWQDGPSTSVVILTSTTLRVTLNGVSHQGELRNDGQLHWDDGDVWTRSSWFEGSWKNRGVIHGHTLTWAHGPSSSPVSAPLVVTGYRTLELAFEGRSYRGELREDGELHWDDGDIWTRQSLEVGTIIRAKPGQQFVSSGSEIFQAGDEGTVTSIYEASSGQQLFDIHWQRTGKRSTYFLASWTQAFTAETQRREFGFSLFGKVQHRYRAGLRQGVVVGFTRREVEVAFPSRGILRCPPDALERVAHSAGGGGSAKPDAASPPQSAPRRTDAAPAAASVSSSLPLAPARSCSSGPAEKRSGSHNKTPAAAPAPQASSVVSGGSAPNSSHDPKCVECGALLIMNGGDRWCAVCKRWVGKKQIVPVQIEAARKPKPTSGSGTAPQRKADPEPCHAKAEERYEGIVKWSRGTMAWVECEALAKRFPDRDVFIHKNDFLGDEMPKQWNRVSFELTRDDLGNPKGLRARVVTEPSKKPEPTMISAHDWFRERDRRREARETSGLRRP